MFDIAPRGCHEKTKGLIDEPMDHSRIMPAIIEVAGIVYPLTYVSRRQYDVIRCISESIEGRVIRRPLLRYAMRLA